MMPHSKTILDSVDYRIMAMVQENSDHTIAEISSSIGVSQNIVWRRMKNLDEIGAIAKRVAILDGRLLGINVVAFIMIRMADHGHESAIRFTQAVAAIPEVTEFYRMAGDVDYMLKIIVPDIGSYDAVYRRLIRSALLVDVSGSFSIETLKCTTSLPLPGPSPSGTAPVRGAPSRSESP